MFVDTEHVRDSPSKPFDPEITDKDVWTLINGEFAEYGLVHHQLESFNEFVLYGAPKTIEENREVEVEGYKVEFGEVIFQRPVHRELSDEVRTITPKECIDRDIDYVAHMFADVVVHPPVDEDSTAGKKLEPRHYPKVHIGSVPVMIKSQLCNLYEISDDPAALAALYEDLYDQGGYFVVKGSPKIIASQQRTAYNKAYVFKDRKSAPKFRLYTEVRSNSISGAHSTTTCVGIKGSLISVVVPYIDMAAIPLAVMFRALGAKDEKDIIRHIPNADREVCETLVASLEQAYECRSQETALHYIGRRGKKFMGGGAAEEDEDEAKTRADAISYARHLLSTEFLPHLGVGEESFVKKRFYLGYMTIKLIETHLGRRQLEDRDHYTNKRIATAGMLFNQLFYTAWKRLRSEISSSIDKCVRGSNAVNILTIIKPNTIRAIMCNALSNNTWTGRGKTPGISQALDRFNYTAGIANARKFVTPINAEGGKIEGPRHLHNSHWGAVCPAETPEGKKCGLVTNAAMQSLITIGSDAFEVGEIVKEMNIVTFEEVAESAGDLLNLVKVFINGDPIGVTRHPNNIVNELRLLRRRGGLNPEVSVAYTLSTREIHISTEAGRVYRALLVVEKGQIRLRKSHIESIRAGEWDDEGGSAWVKLLERGYIELIDKAEEASTLIATYPSDLEKYEPARRLRVTHCEIHPCLMFGVGASLIPYPDHNQSPRNTYQSAMGKQAIGVPGTNYMFQTKGKFHVMNYPQKPLVATKMSEIIGFDKLPAGQNAIVAVCPWYGFGQEDSIIMNQDSIDRGFMLITTYMCFDGKVRRDKNEQFEVPTEDDCSNYKGNPSKLDPVTGIITEGQTVSEGDILIGRTAHVDETLTVHRKKKSNISVLYDHPWPGKVHLVQTGVDGEGYEYVRVVIAQQRPPEYGDKFAARHGQKGTVGMKYRSYDLPFTRDGIAPDIVVNPLALPSRMTIGMLIEMIQGRKVTASSTLHSIPVDKVFRLDDETEEWDDEKFTKKKKSKATDFKSVGDATPFEKDFSLRRITKELKRLGIHEFCDEQMTNGQTGEPMKCLIFTGVCYYQRLKHMVIDKVHARSRGGRTRMTRQPREGRKQGGGFRVGHMERDCLLGQGAPWFAKDRLMEQSDETRIWFCKICGLQALVTAGDSKKCIPPRRECRVCESNQVALVKMPYATKLLMQELAGMNVVVRVLPTAYGEPGDSALISDGTKVIGKGTILKA